MPERQQPIDFAGLSLDDLERLIESRALPPVALWNPTHCGDSNMRIARDGRWYHEGRPVVRPALVRLLSTILRREEDGRHVLVTPVEKLDIAVESTAFQAIELRSEGKGDGRKIAVRLNNDDVVMIGPDHPLKVVAAETGLSPRIMVRHGLEAELSRPLYYELAQISLAEGHDPPGVWSNGAFFSLDVEA